MNRKITYSLPNEVASAFLANSLAQLMLEDNFYPPIFLLGELGAGKTFLTRNLCQALPNSELADISSPSFSLINYYPTKPEVVHADLYRLKLGDIPDELDDALENQKKLVLIEWANQLSAQYFQLEHIQIKLAIVNKHREIELSANTEKTVDFLANLHKKINQTIQLIGG